MIDYNFIQKDLMEDFEQEAESVAQNIVRYRERKTRLLQLVSDGLVDPIIEYYAFTGCGMWPMYFRMPLNKPLFFQKIDEMKELGWVLDGKLVISKSQVTQSLTMGEYPDRISIQLAAVGEGVSCRLVSLKEEKSWEPAVYDWVCEEGAKEMESQLVDAVDDNYIDKEEAEKED